MYDILVNESVVAVVVQPLVKAFVETLIKMLPDVMSVQTREHVEESDKKKSESK